MLLCRESGNFPGPVADQEKNQPVFALLEVDGN
jgi:hypothetical protein